MDLDLLKTFLEVVKTRHFGKAADTLCITQSAVSARIRQLESQLNVRLFDRTTKNVHLTPEGERFINHAETILMAWKSACFDVNPSIEHQQQLSLATTASLWHYVFLPDLIPVVEQQQILLNVLSYSSEDLSRLVFHGAVDLIISYDAVHETGISQQVLGNLTLKLFTTKRQAAKFDIGQTPYVHVDWGAVFNVFVNKTYSDQLQVAMQTNNAQTAEKIIEAIDGMAYLPSHVAEMNPELVALEGKYTPVFRRKIFASYSVDSTKTAELKGLLQLLKW